MPRPKTSKTAKVTAMMMRPTGASLEAICKATGWQSHSARAALSGLRKKGIIIERSTDEGSTPSVYRITGDTGAAQ